MGISYDKMLKLFQERGITSYTMRKEKIIGQATWKKIQEGGNIDTKSLGSSLPGAGLPAGGFTGICEGLKGSGWNE